jgi:hypothetical protein
MRRHAIVVAAAVLLCFPPLARAQRDQVSPANKEALGLAEQLSGGYADAVNAHDAAKAAAFYAPDGELVISEGVKVVRRSQGPAAVEGYYSRLFSENPQLKLELTVESAHLVTSEVLAWGGTIAVKGFSGGAIQGRFFTVSRKWKQEERWLTVNANVFRELVQTN